MFGRTYLEEILIAVEMIEKIVLYIGRDVAIPIRYWGIGIGGIGRYWYWSVLVLVDIGIGGYWYWSVLVLVGVGIGRYWYWWVLVLVGIGIGYWDWVLGLGLGIGIKY